MYCATSRRVAGSITGGVRFLIDLILLVHYDPGFDSASNRHEFSGLSEGVK